MAEGLKTKMSIEIDARDLSSTINALRIVHTPEEMKKILRRALTRTAQRTKSIIADAVPQQYYVKKKEVRSEVKAPKIETGLYGADFSCSIPIRGHRRSIGGAFKASGGVHGWDSMRYKGKRYKITAQIVKSGTSTLPTSIDDHSGNAPFRNKGSKVWPVTFARDSSERTPIAPIVGVAIPQMAMNRAADEEQKQILAYLQERIEQEHRAIMRGIVKG